MKASFVLPALFAAGTLAQAPNYFYVMSTRSASPVHLLPLTARDGKFYLGGPPPSSNCPSEIPEGACPSGETTVLSGGDNYLGMGVVVPGGQSVYVSPASDNGALAYTQPHTSYKPEGSIIDGFSLTQGEQFGSLTWTGGLLACPPAKEGEGWGVFGKLEGVEYSSECLGFNALAVNTTGAGAWEY